MAHFTAMFGENLTAKDGATVKTVDALGGDNLKAVGIYFSAHWCPPCRGFTPKLAELYSEALKEKGLEIVFASSDRDQEAFDDYFKEMPWLALPYSERELKENLSKEHKVQGIPSLVILNAKDGTVITTDGRSVCSDVDAFPWIPRSIEEIMADVKVQAKVDAPLVPLKEAVKGKVLGLYFSAHWCPPCQGFTPELAKTYVEVKKSHPDYDIVFVSWDRDEAQFKEYYEKMPWLALEFEQRQLKEQLNKHFGITGIPALVQLNTDDWSVINKNARTASAKVENFPWPPPLCPDLGTCNDCEGIDETPSLLVLADTLDEENQKRVIGYVETVAKAEREKEKAEYLFFGATLMPSSPGPMAQIKKLCELEDTSVRKDKADAVTALLLDMSSEGAFYKLKTPIDSADVVTGFLADFKAGKLERCQMA